MRFLDCVSVYAAECLTFCDVGQAPINALDIHTALGLQGGVRLQQSMAVCWTVGSKDRSPSSNPEFGVWSHDSVLVWAQSFSELLQESSRSFWIPMNTRAAPSVLAEKKPSPFGWCSYSGVNYNHGKFNLALKENKLLACGMVMRCLDQWD